MNVYYQLIRCPICRQEASSPSGCCQNCALELFQPQRGEGFIALGFYGGKLEKAIKALKFEHTTSLATLFAREMARVVRQQGWQIDLVCAVPLHWTRLLQRGYNQSGLIARRLAKELACPYEQVLSRPKKTRQQAKLSRLERQNNVRHAFKAKALRQQTVLLVDDVVTSGATIQSCAESLLNAGARSVKLIAVAKTPRTPI